MILGESKQTVRKRTRREVGVEGKWCARCGSEDNLRRHHKDYEFNNVEIMCDKCHRAEHKGSLVRRRSPGARVKNTFKVQKW